MASYRCPRCWISCDTRLKAGVHAENTNCNARDRPLNDCFMDTSHEREVEGKFRRATPEEIWWSLFRLLVPQTEHIDDSRLKLMFSPCESKAALILIPGRPLTFSVCCLDYLTQGIVPGSSLMVSPVMIPGNVLHSLQLATCQWGTDGNEGQNL